MNSMANAQQFQSGLAQYISVYSPDYWPVWLTLAGILFVGMLLVLALHAFLRLAFRRKSTQVHEEEKVYLYSKAVRYWHWSNATLFILLLATGLTNHFALASASVTSTLVALHHLCGYLLIVVWFGFVLINLFAGNGHHYRIKPQGWMGRAMKQAKFYLVDIIKGEDHPFAATEQSKFNPLQQVAYLGIMYGLLPLLIITGLMTLNPTWFPTIRHSILQLHLFFAVIGLFFVFAHLYLCTTGRTFTQTFKSMIDGYHRH